MSRFEKVPENMFKHVTFGAGIVTGTFEPTTGVAGPVLFATKNGNSFTAKREMNDVGSTFDNVPEGAKQLQRPKPYKVNLTGTAATVTKETASQSIGSASLTTVGSGVDKITPTESIDISDFKDIWLIVNYSEYNGETNGGWLAIHIMNAYSVDGFSASFKKDENGEFPFNFQGFYDLDNMSQVPFEVYIKAGTAERGDV